MKNCQPFHENRRFFEELYETTGPHGGPLILNRLKEQTSIVLYKIKEPPNNAGIDPAINKKRISEPAQCGEYGDGFSQRDLLHGERKHSLDRDLIYNNNKLEKGTICGGGAVFTQLQNQLGGRSEHCVLSCSCVLSKSPQLHS